MKMRADKCSGGKGTCCQAKHVILNPGTNVAKEEHRLPEVVPCSPYIPHMCEHTPTQKQTIVKTGIQIGYDISLSTWLRASKGLSFGFCLPVPLNNTVSGYQLTLSFILISRFLSLSLMVGLRIRGGNKNKSQNNNKY